MEGKIFKSQENLVGCDFSGQLLKDNSFIFLFCDLRKADFFDSNLKKARFICCDLEEADFRNADLREANFKGSVGLTKKQLSESFSYEGALLPDYLDMKNPSGIIVNQKL